MTEIRTGGNFVWNSKKSTVLSIVVCIVVIAILTAGIFFGPWAMKTWFILFRGWDADSDALQRLLTVFKACFYPCSVFAYIALYSLLRLLFNIRKQMIFDEQNVKYLRVISWCCFAVSLITFVGGFFYLPFFFVAAAAAFVGLMLRIVKNVMQNAVEIKAENELTI